MCSVSSAGRVSYLGVYTGLDSLPGCEWQIDRYTALPVPQLKTSPSYTYILHPQHPHHLGVDHTAVWNCTVSNWNNRESRATLELTQCGITDTCSTTLCRQSLCTTSCHSLGFVLPLLRCRHQADGHFCHPPDQLCRLWCILRLKVWRRTNILHRRKGPFLVLSLLTKNNLAHYNISLPLNRTAKLLASAGANDTLCVYLVHT